MVRVKADLDDRAPVQQSSASVTGMSTGFLDPRVFLLLTFGWSLAACGETGERGSQATGEARSDAGEAGDDDVPGDDDDAPSVIGSIGDILPEPQPNGDDSAPSADDDGALEPVPADDPQPDPQSQPTPGLQLSLPERYIARKQDTRLMIEIDSVSGMEPRRQSEQDIVERFSALLDKPDGVEIEHDDAIESRGADYRWTDDELFELAPSIFDDDEPAGTVSLHVMFLDGSYQSESGGTVLGVAWANRHIAMFTEVINQSCSSAPLLGELSADACRASEFGVWSHELGHVLGLVNNGISMQSDHEDSEHPHHDSEAGCLMYWAYDGPSFVDTTITRLAAGRGEIDFCAPSLADLAAVRER